MAKSKDFTNNPAMSFISKESIDKVDKPKSTRKAKTSAESKPPKGYKPNPEFIETKSKRVQILLQPSLHEEVKTRAKAEGISFNEAVTIALREYIER